jgi:hypothetical protein
MQIDFMMALRPIEKNNNKAGEPDWDKERTRYLQNGVPMGTSKGTGKQEIAKVKHRKRIL